MIFGAYAKYYNLLYSERDYHKEFLYIDGLIKKYNNQTSKILELGCGTGESAVCFADAGYQYLGIDNSEGMLESARKYQRPGLEFQNGDIKDFRTDQKFDSVISLFHVTSYQTTDEGLLAFFETARKHLDAGGLFIIDIWYLPCVMAVKPERREKKMENDEISVVRYANPVHHIERNVVDVNYKIDITEKKTYKKQSIKETHSMRYFTIEELQGIMKKAGFEFIMSEEWLTHKKPDESTWWVCLAGRAV